LEQSGGELDAHRATEYAAAEESSRLVDNAPWVDCTTQGLLGGTTVVWGLSGNSSTVAMRL